jgi:anti-anti-sigma regulatory factor
VSVTFDQSDEQCLLRLEGGITIGVAAELKAHLQQALASGKALRVDLQQATELDITALQLLWAAGCEAKESGREFRLAGKLPPEIATAATEAGMERFPVPSE